MIRLTYIILLLFVLFITNNAISQYYTPAQISTIDANRTAAEGDLYLDTVNDIYRIGLTNGKLGDVSNKTLGQIDSIKTENNFLKIYSASTNVDSVDLSNIGSGATVGDVKFGFINADHSGWYLLDGRLITSLPATALANAISLGFATNLPDATDRVLKHPSATEANGDVGGNATTTLTQANLPNVNFTGTTGNQAAHSHDIQNMTNAQNRMVNNSDSNLDVYIRAGGNTTTTSAAGDHSHTVTVPTGGTDTPFDNYQPYLVSNIFIYLGL